jgi:hypothetical protein
MHYVQQELAQVLQDRPSPDVVPPTIDLVDVMDSNVAAAYCDHVADPTEANFDRALNRAALWSVITGMGFMKWVWDPNEKKHCILPCNWFDVFLDPYATDFAKNRYIIHSQFLDPEQVYEAWGVTVKPGAVQKADLARTQLMRGMGSAPVLSGVTVNELWMKPCRSTRAACTSSGPGPTCSSRRSRCRTTTSGCRSRRSAASSARTRSTS